MITDERKEILEQQIFQYISQGWTVQSQTDLTAQLLSLKKGCQRLIMIISGIFYVGRKDETLYIIVDENGVVQK